MTTPAPPPPSDLAIGLASDEMSYRYRPRMMGAEFAFRLEPHALAWELGQRSGRLAYRDIARLRLGFRPANLAGSRFIAEIWSREGMKFEIASITQRSLFDYQNLAVEYRAFVVELARRIAASGGACRCEAGFPPWRWWPALFVAAATLVAAVYVSLRALIAGDVVNGAAIAAIGLFFVWQIGGMIVRNRPRLCDLQSIPTMVLPKLAARP
jgi:hypothetical protein